MMERKTVRATIKSVSEPSADKPYGGFTARASDGSTDRDGENLLRDEWVTPLPDRITVDIDHGMSVGTTVGSAHPYFVGDELWVDAAFSSIERAQEVRTLVREGHVTTVSVAALVDRSQKGAPRRELLNVGIVAVPANRNSVITDSKGAKGLAVFNAALSAVLDGQPVHAVIKSVSSGDGAMLQAIHDASSHLGAVCKSYDPDELDDDGEGVENDDYDDTGDEDGANKSLQLRALQLRMRALAR